MALLKTRPWPRMTEFSTLLQQGNAWLFIPSAILLGALHGLEPGHSKTMMAAFIVAIRGTLTQAVLLGLSATISHTAVVWAVAMAGLYFGRNWNAEATEPYFQVASAVLIIGVAAWMIWRTLRDQRMAHAHDHDHDHDEARDIDTGHGTVRLEVFEDGVPPRLRLYQDEARPHGHVWSASDVHVETERPDGTRQSFHFVQRDGFVESEQTIPEPHEFVARLSLGRDRHRHSYDVEFVEHGHDHPHHAIQDYDGLDLSARLPGCPRTGACQRHPPPLRQPARHDRPDHRFRPHRRPDPLPRLHHGAVALPAAQADHAGGNACAVLQHRTGHDDGGIRRAGRTEREARIQALERDSATSRERRRTSPGR